MRSVTMRGALLLAAAAFLSACSSASSPGPLGGASDSATVCMPAEPGHWYTVGIWALSNHGKSAVTIDSVRLPRGAGVRMTAAWLAPVYHNPQNGNYELVGGVGYPWPPSLQIAPTWDRRQPAAGAVIRPGVTWTLVFGVSRIGARTGRSGGPVITYSVGGSRFTVQKYPDLVLAGTCEINGG